MNDHNQGKSRWQEIVSEFSEFNQMKYSSFLQKDQILHLRQNLH